MREGCKTDILVRPINIVEDIWLPVQLKVTSEKNKRYGRDRYSFNIGENSYDNMLLLLICSKDATFWLFDSNNEDIRSLQRITIGIKKSKYDNKYVDNLVDSFNYWYKKNVYNITFETGNTPQSKTARLEYEYVKLRESIINFLEFDHNELDGLVYDFKIQEKVCTPFRKTHVSTIHKNGGWVHDGTKRKQTYIPYCEGDNDYYWFNLQDKNTFYVVPEIELIDRGFITTKDNKGKTNITISSNEHWLHCYKFYYDTISENVNKEELMLILGLI